MRDGENRGRILLVDDDTAVRLAMTRGLRRAGYEVDAFPDGMTALSFLREHPDVELLVTDLKMPGMDGITVLRRARELVPDIGILMVTAYASVDTAVEAMKHGASDYIEKPIDLDVLRRRVENLVEKVRLGREVTQFREIRSILEERGSFEGMIGQSRAMLELFRKIQQVAPTTSSVLIVGESGVGKELVARALHRRSERARETFLPVDCAAIPAELIESELFGHERGAFTGAQARKPGKFELAHKGTLFLDEIGEVPLGVQAKLLRALETRTFMRVGGTEEITVDVRVLAATNRNLEEMSREGKFRADLYYRLNVVTLEIPPLRERRDDIPLLATAFLEQFAREHDRPVPVLTPEALQVLKAAPWPGNVRELRNLMQSLVILHPGTEIGVHHLPEPIRRAVEESAPAVEGADPAASFVGKKMEDIEREVILRTLEMTGGNRSRAAQALGIGLRTLQRKIKQYRAEGHHVAGGPGGAGEGSPAD